MTLKPLIVDKIQEGGGDTVAQSIVGSSACESLSNRLEEFEYEDSEDVTYAEPEPEIKEREVTGGQLGADANKTNTEEPPQTQAHL